MDLSTKPNLEVSSFKFDRYQKFVVALLAFLQFTVVLDFMILSPLGALLMPKLGLSPGQFGAVVSVYAFSAGLSGFLASAFADRFDRKKLLLFFYSGFILGTLFCALAPNYWFLLSARMITGLFGGVIASIVFAITTDLFPFEVRGRVMGVIQTAFAASQVMGIPIGLFLANRWGWHAPFVMIVGASLAVGLLIIQWLKPINKHLQLSKNEKPFSHVLRTVTNRTYLEAFATTALLTTGGFMIMPFSSAFTVHNLGISMEHLPTIYLATGISSILMGPLIGRASDRFGKFKLFVFGSILTIIMVSIYTRLESVSMAQIILISIILFIGISSRLISSQALVSAIPSADSRGSFMSISSSIQQVSGGLASLLAGLIVVEEAGGHLKNFEKVGDVVILAGVINVWMMYRIHKRVPEKTN